MGCSLALPSASHRQALQIPCVMKLDTTHNLPIKQSGGNHHPCRLPPWRPPISGVGRSCLANMPFEPCGAGMFSLSYFHVSPSFYLGHCWSFRMRVSSCSASQSTTVLDPCNSALHWADSRRPLQESLLIRWGGGGFSLLHRCPCSSWLDFSSWDECVFNSFLLNKQGEQLPSSLRRQSAVTGNCALAGRVT